MSGARVVLVGPGQQGNLALNYLAAAVEEAGHTARVLRYDGRQDLERCVPAVLGNDPHLVGLGIAFQYAIEDYVMLAEALRRGGYRGHITCGGHVPTFCYEELLRDVPALDTAVRHDGERTLVEMLDGLMNGSLPRNIQGLVWRVSGGVAVGPTRPFVADLDELPWPKRPAKPYAVAGVPITFFISSRGCVGECAYCSIRAFGRDAGGPRLRLRQVDAVADELAYLHHRLGIRLIVVQDDLFILPDEEKSVERMRAIGAALRKRGAEGMLFWIKGRPEAITERVVKAALEMGSAHIFLGVENFSTGRLRYLGRRHQPEDAVRAIALCDAAGLQVSFNLMLFDPDCTLADVALNLDFAERYTHCNWNICRTEIYPGTGLHSRLKRAGRLEGDYRTFGYTMRDEAAEIMFRILRVCFHERAFHCDSLLNQLITLSFARRIHELLLPGPGTEDTARRIDILGNEVYRDSLSELRRIMEFASSADINALSEIRDFAVEKAMSLNERDHHWLSRAEEIASLLDARGSRIVSE